MIETIINFFVENYLLSAIIIFGLFMVYKSGYYSENFESKKTLILYYAPWCPHCKPVKPMFEELQKIYANDENINIILVNGDEQPELLKEKNIQGFPSIVLYTDDSQDLQVSGIEYNGTRSVKNFQTFIQSY